MLLNISRIKGNKTMKFGQLIEHPMIFFFEKYAENEAGKLVPDHFLFFKGNQTMKFGQLIEHPKRNLSL